MSLIDVSTGTAYAGREANHALSFRQFNKSKHAQYFTPVWLADLLFEAFNSLIPPEGPASISVLRAAARSAFREWLPQGGHLVLAPRHTCAV